MTTIGAIKLMAALLVAANGMECQIGAIREFFSLVHDGSASVADVRRLTTFDGENEAEFQRCLLFPAKMKRALCFVNDRVEQCTFYPRDLDDGFPLNPGEEAEAMRRVTKGAAKTKPELAAFLGSRWPEAFSIQAGVGDIDGPQKDGAYPKGILYRVRSRAGTILVGFNTNACRIESIQLADGTVPMGRLDCLWRQRAKANSPPAPSR